ncbi:fluoride efflux transporter FluC [Brochothrix thermosphacta]|uniref:fluoride efflux transporter FluC n=1 Tax=Brochothrix thermosphacta TaxID=2756 RepID=UPI0039B0EFFC
MSYLLMFLFGSLGGMSRYGIGLLFQSDGFPYGTLIVNLLGCFFLVIVNEYMSIATKIPKMIIMAIGTGFIGAFTTFSAFSIDFVRLFKAGEIVLALSYFSVSLIGSFLMIQLAYYLVHKLLNKRRAKG